MTNVELRKKIVEEARSWIGTPYVLRGEVKGPNGGCDCGSFLLSVYKACGLMKDEELGIYNHDWWLHKDSAMYVNALRRNAKLIAERVFYKTDKLEAGNLIICQAANRSKWNHGAIVTAWPFIVHNLYGGVKEVDATRDPTWSYKTIEVYDPIEVKL